MRTEGINLRYARHCSNKRRTYRTSRAYKIAVSFTVCNKLLSRHIQNREAVLCDSSKFSVKTFLDDFRERVAVFVFSSLPCNGCKLFLCTVNKGRVYSGGNWSYLFHHIGNFVGIFHNYFVCFLIAEIFKLPEHFGSCSEIQRSLSVSVRKAFGGHKYFAVVAFVRIHKVNVTGCDNRFFKLIGKLYYCSVKVLKLLFGLNSTVFEHKEVVPYGLYFEVVIKRSDFL